MSFNKNQPRDDEGKWTDGAPGDVGGKTGGSHSDKVTTIAKAFDGVGAKNPITMNEVTARIHDMAGGKGDGDMGPFENGKEARRMVLELVDRGVVKTKWMDGTHWYWLARGKQVN